MMVLTLLRRAGGVAIMLLVAVQLILAASASAVTNPPTYRSAVLSDHPLAYYRLGEAQGAVTAVDQTGAHNAAYGPATLGLLGALNDRTFAGQNVTFSTSLAVSEHTIEFWANNSPDPPSDGVRTQAWMQHGTGQQGWTLTAHEPALDPSGSTYTLTTPQGTIDHLCQPPNWYSGWRYYVITWHGNLVDCYVDGTLQSTRSAPATIDTNTAVPLQLLVNPSGYLDEVAFYTSSVTAAQASAHYQDARGPYVLSYPALTDTTLSGRDRDQDVESTTLGNWSGSFGSATDNVYAYSWERCPYSSYAGSSTACTPIAGATSTTYQLQPDDVGQYIRSVVTASNGYATVTAASATTKRVSAILPSNSVAPSTTGTAQEGEVLDSTLGSWDGTAPITYSYQWLSCTTPNDPATCANEPDTNSTAVLDHYWIGTYDVGKYIRLQVTAANDAGAVSALTPATAQVIAGTSCNTPEGCEILNSSSDPELPGIEDLADSARQATLLGVEAEGPALPDDDLYTVDGTGSALVASGRILKADGTPATGQAAVFAAPADPTGTDPWIPVGEVNLDSLGNYAIRTPLTGAMEAIGDDLDGIANMELVVFTAESTYVVDFVRVFADHGGTFTMTDMRGRQPSTSTVRLNSSTTNVLTPFQDDIAQSSSTACKAGCSYSAWDCQDTGGVLDVHAARIRVGELHTGDNFNAYMDYERGRGSASSAGIEIGAAVSDSRYSGFSASGTQSVERSFGVGASTRSNPLARNHNKFMNGVFDMGTQPQRCARSVSSHGVYLGKQYKDHYRSRLLGFDGSLEVGADASAPTKNHCASSRYVTEYWVRRRGDSLDVDHFARNTQAWSNGLTFAGITLSSSQSYTNEVVAGIHMRPSDGAPYRICGTDQSWRYARTWYAGSFATWDVPFY